MGEQSKAEKLHKTFGVRNDGVAKVNGRFRITDPKKFLKTYYEGKKK